MINKPSNDWLNAPKWIRAYPPKISPFSESVNDRAREHGLAKIHASYKPSNRAIKRRNRKA